MNYQMPMAFNGMMPLPSMPFNQNNSIPMMQLPIQNDNDNITNRISLLEQKIQNIENRLKKLEKGTGSIDTSEGYYQYKNSMYMM